MHFGVESALPLPDFVGTESFKYTVRDSNHQQSNEANVTVTVRPPNVAPSFTIGQDQTIYEDAAAQTINGWASSIDDGDAGYTQLLHFDIINNSNPGLFAVPPAISPSGDLTYTSAHNANGKAIITVILKDDGGVLSGGVDTSFSKTFTINVTPVNDAPSFTAINPPFINEDSGAQSISAWATFNPGPVDESSQTVVGYAVGVVSNPSLFSVLPAVDNNGTLTYTPAPNANGIVTFTLTVTDSGSGISPNANSSIFQTFTININPANDPPAAVNDAATVVEGGTVSVLSAPAAATSVIANDSDLDMQPLVVTARPVTEPSHGSLILNFDGTFSYSHDNSETNNDSFVYQVCDTDALPLCANATVSINIMPVNDAPKVDLDPNIGGNHVALMYTESHPVVPILLNKGITVTDSDNTNINSATVVLSNPLDTTDELLGINSGLATGFGITALIAPSGHSIALSGSSTLDRYRQVLQSVTYSNSSNNPNTTVVRTINFTVNDGSLDSIPSIASVTILNVNSAPVFTKGVDQTVFEDAGIQTINNWATGLSDGDGSTQTLSFNVTANSNAALFETGPAIDVNGNLSYKPAANANGSATITLTLQDDGGTANSGVDTSTAQTFTIQVTAVNDAPSFTKGADQTVFEDAGGQTVNSWATAISAGPADEVGQALSFSIANNSNPGLFSTAPAIDASGVLTYALVANKSGTATINVTLSDNGGTANGGIDTDSSQSFLITVTNVNDAPSFTKGVDQTVLEDVGLQTVNNWATGLSDGDGNTQTLSFNVTANSNAALFETGPTIDTNGNLSYKPAANANGSATITLTLQDDGGTANSGVDTSTAQTFTIQVTAVNDAPSFTKGADPTVPEDASGQTVNSWATAISAGPADEVGQTLSFLITNNSNPGLFSILPAIDASGNLTYSPAADANGSASITISVSDNGLTNNGGSDTSAVQTFLINVTAVNDEPSFIKGANQSVNEDSGSQTVNGWATGLSKGPANESAQTLSFNVTDNTNTSIFEVGAEPAVDSNGNLTYKPAADANGSATITLEIKDNGGTANGGDDTSATQSFVISVIAVNDPPSVTAPGPFSVTGNISISIAAPGLLTTVSDSADGVGASPFSIKDTTITSVKGGTVTVDTNTGAFTYNPPAGYEGADTFTYYVCDSGVPDASNDCTASATVTLNIDAMIWFIDNSASSAGDGRLSSPFKTLAEFQAINGVADTATVFNPAADDNIFLYESASPYIGPVTLFNNQKLIGQDSTATLAAITGITPPSNSPALPAMNSGNGTLVTITSASNAIQLANTASGSIQGLSIGNATSSAIANVGASFGTLAIQDTAINTSGQALNLANGTLNADFTSLSSSGGTNNVSLTAIAGTSSFGSGSLSGASNTALLISSGTAAITYDGSIIKSTAGKLIDIQSHSIGAITLNGALASTSPSTGINIASNSSGTIAFTNPSKVLNTGVNDALTISNNSGATINFTNGGLAITATSGKGINATGGASAINVTGTSNTISNDTGTALNVANTTIGASGLIFESISANGATNGIVLNNTGTNGGLTVTGSGNSSQGGNNSGGIIQNTSSDAIKLTSTHNVSLTNMRIQNIGTGINDAAGAIDASNLTGINHFRAGVMTGLGKAGVAGGIDRNGVTIINTNTNMTSFSIENSVFSDSDGTSSFIFTSARGTSTMGVTVSDSDFSDLVALAVQVNAGDSESGVHTVTTNITNNVFRNASAAGGQGGIAVTSADQDATHNFTISNNTLYDLIKGIAGGNSEIVLAQTTGGALNGTISGNTIGNSLAGNGDRRGIGVIAEPDVSINGELGSVDIVIENNTIDRLPNREAIFVDLREDTQDSELIVRNNNIGLLAGYEGLIGGDLTKTGAQREAIDIQTRGEVTRTLNLLLSGNNVRANTSVNVVNLEVNIDNGTPGNLTMHSTVTGNTFKNDDLLGSAELIARPRDAGAVTTLCLDMSGNVLDSGNGQIDLNETGVLNVEQVSSAALASANGIPGANVLVTGGAPSFGVTCFAPPN